jgi:hypothetical protein
MEGAMKASEYVKHVSLGTIPTSTMTMGGEAIDPLELAKAFFADQQGDPFFQIPSLPASGPIYVISEEQAS